MIKCFWFWKLLKQFFIISLISCFGFLVNSFASAWYTREIWITGFSPFDNSVNLSVLKKWSFLSSVVWTAKDIFYMSENFYFAWLYNSNLGGVSLYNYTNWQQWYIKHYALCNPITWQSLDWTLNDSSNCTIYDYSIWNMEIINNFLLQVNSYDYFWFDKFSNSNGSKSTLCISSINLWKSLCFENCYVSNSNYYACSMYWNYSLGVAWDLTWSLDLDWQFWNVPNYLLYSSPAVAWNTFTGWNNEVSDSEGLEDYNYVWLSPSELVYYFENSPEYKFNQNVCKVWTDDFITLLSTVYNSGGVSFSAWLGSDLFQLYSSLYWTSFTITEVWSFTNVWRNNYWTIFMTSASDRLYRMIYNWNWTVSLEYDNLDIARYMSLPYVYYTFWQLTYAFWNSSSIWEEIATYCYYKLWYYNNSDYSIVDDHNLNYDSSAWAYNDNVRRSQWYRSWSTSIISQSWSWTPLDYFSWDDNLDFSTFFSKSFNKFRDNFSMELTNQDLWAWFLPTYIIMFLLAIILFRFLFH